ncbi:hypothetical protein BC828DRAFT_180825 [Blastocladiella britannica]|nr:hypothetical protein BC828DRAFT_180825 [Blastocladiella britannica]
MTRSRSAMAPNHGAVTVSSGSPSFSTANHARSVPYPATLRLSATAMAARVENRALSSTAIARCTTATSADVDTYTCTGRAYWPSMATIA